MKTVHKCPICNGSGKVPGGFYTSINGNCVSTSSIDKCKTCQGQGVIILDEESPNYNNNNNLYKKRQTLRPA